MILKNKKILGALLLLLVVTIAICSCAGTPETPSTDTSGAADTAGDAADAPIPDPDPSYTSDKYNVISKEEYMDKITAAFLGQLAGFLSGHEFSTSGDGGMAVAMPESKFEYLGGLYADDPRCDKHIKQVSSGIWEVWFDDDFSVDVVNQYILGDMYRQKKTPTQKYISDGWITYDVWDMGGGQRQAGAFGNIQRHGYLPQFAGNGEFDNWYSYLSEPYLATDTLGFNAAGMPETAKELSGMFAQVTGDRDNVLWAQMFATMISNAFFESDIQTLIMESCKVFPEGSWPLQIIEDVFTVYEKYPNDWRKAYIEFEAKHCTKYTSDAGTDINCGFVILDLLYGGGDYMTTCKIGSLAGYDCESTCGIALAVLGIIGGTEILPEDTNTYIWQDGEGILTNKVFTSWDQGVWMKAGGLPERIKISKVLEKYQKNFESVLEEMGGESDDYYYYIPKQTLGEYDTIEIENSFFGSGDTTGFETEGTVTMTDMATMGQSAVELKNNASISQTVSGLEVGKTYALSAYIRTSSNGTAYLFASEVNGQNAVCASVHQTQGSAAKNENRVTYSAVKRTLVFTATAGEMKIGVKFVGTGDEYAIADAFNLFRITETKVGEVTIENKTADNKCDQVLTLTVNSETNKEAYLKITFANPNGEIKKLPLTVNYLKYATMGLYKTCETEGMEGVDCVYVPLTLIKGENSIVSTYSGAIYVYSVEYVELTTTY